MFLDFFLLLKNNGLPVSLREYLLLLEALKKGHGQFSVEEFYFLAKAVMIKHENQLDRFDMLFGHYFKGTELINDKDMWDIPDEWLRKELEKTLSEEEKAMIEALGGWDEMLKRFKELLEEQKERHQGGNRWIGTGGTSPFGAFGYNPMGYRIGQNESRHRRAIKVWDKRDFANLKSDVELNTRNIKMALRRLRVFTREGVPDELDLDQTIKKTSQNAGILELEMVPAKQNRVKVLLLFDIGGSMDDHIRVCEELFSAARHEFKHLEYYYFHNCLYESVWKDNRRRFSEKIPTFDLINKYNRDYRVIFVGDASMSPYEIVYPGGSVEHWNDEAGVAWLQRVREHFEKVVWINPVPEQLWTYTQSILMLQELFEDKMYPMTVEGLGSAMKELR